jgi:hypothetical protein
MMDSGFTGRSADGRVLSNDGGKCPKIVQTRKIKVMQMRQPSYAVTLPKNPNTLIGSPTSVECPVEEGALAP